MNQALSIMKTGLQAQETQLAIVAHNMSNVGTPGFKRSRALFQSLPYQIEQAPAGATQEGYPVSPGIQMGMGTHLVGTQHVFTESNQPIITDQPLDISVVGQGFLRVQMNNGEIGYTRDGRLDLNSDGQLTTLRGQLIMPEITVPLGARDVKIDEAGIVSAVLPGSTLPDEIGQVTLASFVNPSGLVALDGNLFKESSASGAPIVGNPGEDGLGKLKSGQLEGSNVQAVEQMLELVMVQRAFEMSAKIVSGSGEMLQNLAQSVR